MRHLQKTLGVSERRACRVLGQARATQRHAPGRFEQDRALVRRLHELARKHPRYGYRRITALLRREPEYRRVNRKRVYRLWREAGLQVPQRQRKRRRMGTGDNSTLRLCPTHPNHVWSYDFVFDATENGRALKILVILDEFTRECLALVVGRSLTHVTVLETVDALASQRGYPSYIRSDNGPEFIAHALQKHFKAVGAQTRYIDPGAPWQNAYTESFNGKLRDELLTCEVFGSLREAQVLIEQWRRHYNAERPHSALGYQTPLAYAATFSSPIQLINPTPILTQALAS